MRILVAETLDPDGAMVRWASPDLLALGHAVLPLPTQELAPVLGARGLGAWIEAVAEAFGPALIVVCPPYDHAPAATWTRCRALGAKVVGFAMDEPLFDKARARAAIVERYADAVRAFDRLYTTAPAAASALASRGLPARWLRWAMSPTALPSGSVSPAAAMLGSAASPSAAVPGLAISAVLVGRAYERRVALVRRLAERVPVHVFGHGWGAVPRAALGDVVVHGPLAGDVMGAVLAAAGVVVTSGDWESTPIAMVKYRLLEAAFAGAVQVAQDAPDLAAYFPADEVPRYRDDAALAALATALLADPAAARAMAARARARAAREHTWTARFAELAADLGLATEGDHAPVVRPAVYDVGLLAAAGDAERRGATRLAAALFAAVDDAMGLARTLLTHDPARAATAAARAIAERDAAPAATTGLYMRLPTPAPALGHVGFLDPTPELHALELTARLRAGDVAGAEAALAALIARGDPDRLVATAAILQADADPTHAPLWRSLFGAALAATPADRDLHDQHRARFDATCRVVSPR